MYPWRFEPRTFKEGLLKVLRIRWPKVKEVTLFPGSGLILDGQTVGLFYVLDNWKWKAIILIKSIFFNEINPRNDWFFLLTLWGSWQFVVMKSQIEQKLLKLLEKEHNIWLLFDLFYYRNLLWSALLPKWLNINITGKPETWIPMALSHFKLNYNKTMQVSLCNMKIIP